MVAAIGCRGKDKAGAGETGLIAEDIEACTLSENYCVEFGDGWTGKDAADLCAEMDGSQAGSACPEGALGSCEIDDGAVRTTHFYDMNVLDAQGYCSYLAGVWTAAD
jgi:hypothetical protein